MVKTCVLKTWRYKNKERRGIKRRWGGGDKRTKTKVLVELFSGFPSLPPPCLMSNQRVFVKFLYVMMLFGGRRFNF